MGINKIYKYRIWCNTDSKWEYNYSESDSETSLPCPVNTSHSVDDSKLSILSSLSASERLFKQHISQGGPSHASRGLAFTAAFGTTTQADFDVTEDLYLKEGNMVSDGNVVGDLVTVQLIDYQGLVYPAGTVMHEFAKDHGVSKSGETNINNPAITEMNFNGFRLRTIYNSKGTTNVEAVITFTFYTA